MILTSCSLLKSATTEAPKSDCLIYADALPIYAKDVPEALELNKTSVAPRIKRVNAIFESRCPKN